MTTITAGFAGLTNRSVYNHMLVKKANELDKSTPICRSTWSIAGAVIGISACIMFVGVLAIPRYDREGNTTLESLRNMTIFEGLFAGIIITTIALGIIVSGGCCLKSSRKMKKMDVYLLNFPQKKDSKGIIGMENLLGCSQRKDLLIQGFESQFPKSALKELNFDQLILLYEECPKVVNEKRAHLHPSFQKTFLELEKFLVLDPEQLGVLLNDINQQTVLTDERLVALLIKYLTEPQFSNKNVHSALTTLYKKVNVDLKSEDLKQRMDQLRGKSSRSDDTIIDLEESI